ncbi:hypothetical protein Goshw_024744 [Gossypium schwendimanii]|uniref:FLZ-type domain-containing protein n=1 Tax=Gossypium schwendimanii TaxID=34291 RepID=A0A7J9KMY4_GOSSC|nr:hypothetical protein [Gossypium schwendimanii]
MLGTRGRPMIGNLSELLVPTHKSGLSDPSRSPKSPLDLFKTPSSSSRRGSMKRCYDVFGDGVGLGIIALMEKSTVDHHPSCQLQHTICRFKGRFQENSEEDYTFVTRHGESSTKVYFSGGEEEEEQRLVGKIKEITSLKPRFVQDFNYPTSDFLSSCHLCKKKLHGKDIYMYRGEKAFCSAECRSSQIMMDERKEQCKSKASKSGKNQSLGYDKTEQIFSTGILAI